MVQCKSELGVFGYSPLHEDVTLEKSEFASIHRELHAGMLASKYDQLIYVLAARKTRWGYTKPLCAPNHHHSCSLATSLCSILCNI